MEDVVRIFKETFNKEPEHVFDCGGRFEILGNHTDHNHGLCLAATCNLKIEVAVSKRNDNIVNLYSVGYSPISIDISDLSHKEENDSSKMIKGIVAYLKNNGYRVGGFDAISDSTIFPGAGVSSSAAFQMVVAEIFNYFYNNDQIPSIIKCKAGQYAENNYCNKASGLLDQIGVSYGDVSYIDFSDINNPKVEQIDFPFDDLSFVIINTGGSHATLNDLYSAIPRDMHNAAHKCGVSFLNETNEEIIRANEDKLTRSEFNRSLHFFGENRRVKDAVEALKNKDKNAFMSLIDESCYSSAHLLKNMMVENQYEGSPLEAIDILKKEFKNDVAIKINGGGFAGTVIAVVKNETIDQFLTFAKERFGDKNVNVVYVRKERCQLVK